MTLPFYAGKLNPISSFYSHAQKQHIYFFDSRFAEYVFFVDGHLESPEVRKLNSTDFLSDEPHFYKLPKNKTTTVEIKYFFTNKTKMSDIRGCRKMKLFTEIYLKDDITNCIAIIIIFFT